jgi:hypothetical protein
MADTRINALSTATSSVSDDFVPIDGTTNGTRKLSAFSPTFGGNATVTGTLTVNGGTTLNATLVVSSNVGTIGKSGTGTGGNWRFVSDDGTTRWLSGILGGAGETSFSIYDIANSRSLLTATAAGVVQINQTTASTSTSSGALVVRGGVGVAGDVYAGGTTGFKLGSSSGAYRFSAGAFIDAESSSVVRLLDSSANFATVKTGSLIALTPATAPSLTVNSTMTFELTSNTTLKVFVRGTDGTTRSVSLTLA